MRRLLAHRFWFLGIANALILFHIFFYYVLGKRSVGCVDFFGLATFLGNGQITAGTVFLGLIVVTSLIFGRVFCGWGCHFAFFQDGLVKLLHGLGFRIPFRRSRLEWIVPPILFAVTLLYPIVSWWRERGLPQSVTMDISYPDLWHLLPGVKGILLILFVDVIVLTLLFGGRAFCRYLCPYGLFLKFFHALSPTRVVKSGDCSDCGSCTRACPTGVPIKYELDEYGVIHDLNCMNCGDCVVACPTGALTLKPTKAAYSRSFDRTIRAAGQPRWVEMVLFAGAVAGLVVYRGREYGDFLAAGMGLAVGALSVAAVRPNRFMGRALAAKISGAFPRLALVTTTTCLLLGMTGQFLGQWKLDKGEESLQARDYKATQRAYSTGRRIANVFGLFTFYLDDFDDRAMGHVGILSKEADQLMKDGQWEEAALVYQAVIASDPNRLQAYGNMGTALLKQGSYWEAARCYMRILEADPNDLVALYHLAMTRIQLGQMDAAADIVHEILTIDTVGNAYELIRANPLFNLLSEHPRYRRAMSMYQPVPRRAGDP